mmetsp:Transcript_14469/g.21479  ORF Transcript_14469/g.21479 Transcript_14469/m.21479 type:complete len:246 (-) Transcript_14469:13-750(-)
MVTFSCEGCNSTLKRTQVVNHRYKCKFSSNLSCIDCSKTFEDDYLLHKGCISEAEKHEKSLFKGKSEKKNTLQEVWLEIVNKVSTDPSTPEKLRPTLKRLDEIGNVPRQRTKFMKYLKNSLMMKNDDLCESLWNLLYGTLQLQKENESKKNEIEISSQKKEEEIKEKSEISAESFNFAKAAKKILKKNDNKLPLKELKEKLRSKLVEKKGIDNSEAKKRTKRALKEGLENIEIEGKQACYKKVKT